MVIQRVVVNKIHTDDLRHLFDPVLIHGFHIILIQAGNPQILGHPQGIPGEIGLFFFGSPAISMAQMAFRISREGFTA